MCEKKFSESVSHVEGDSSIVKISSMYWGSLRRGWKTKVLVQMVDSSSSPPYSACT